MKIIKVLSFTFFLSSFCYSQGINNFWMCGYYKSLGIPWGPTTLDFFNGSPSIYYDAGRNMGFDFTGAAISDSSGNLLFYTNGVYIANRFHQPMLNGTGLNPSSFTSQCEQDDIGLAIIGANIILPFPDHTDEYFLIHETFDDIDYPYPSYLYFSKIDMQADSGRGEVVLKNQIIISDTLAAQIVACKHANGRDWWIVASEHNQTRYYVLLLSPSGISLSSIQNIGTRWRTSGQAVFSPDGSTYASYDTYADLEVYDFDRCTGNFSNPRNVSINDSMLCLGVSFSPNGRRIYASSTTYLYQFDLDKPNLADYDTVAVWDGTYSPSPPFATAFFAQALRPDGKVYVTTGNTTDRMHTIDYPDSSGMSCHVSQHNIILPTYSNTCPTFPNYFLGPVVGSVCDSLTTGIKNDELTLQPIRVFPNPAGNSFWLNYALPNNRDGWLRIFDINGKLVQQRRLYWSTTALQYYSDALQNGLYFLEVQSDGGLRISTKLVVQH